VKEARLRIVRRFITLLESDEYVYVSDETTERLVILIYNAMYSLSHIQTGEWHRFLILFREAKSKALARAITVDEKVKNYDNSVSSLLNTFEKYIQYIQSL
jgi:hypothetical protein